MSWQLVLPSTLVCLGSSCRAQHRKGQSVARLVHGQDIFYVLAGVLSFRHRGHANIPQRAICCCLAQPVFMLRAQRHQGDAAPAEGNGHFYKFS
jgi:hypothetical protein